MCRCNPDDLVASALTGDLTMTPDGELSTPAGFFLGLRASFSVTESDGRFGTRLIFQSDVTTANRDRIARQAVALDLQLVWLGPNDFWPNCVGESDCFLAIATVTAVAPAFPGLSASLSATGSDGSLGTRLIFRSDVTTANRDRIARQAVALDLQLVWLGPNDFWPNCVGESDCFLGG